MTAQPMEATDARETFVQAWHEANCPPGPRDGEVCYGAAMRNAAIPRITAAGLTLAETPKVADKDDEDKDLQDCEICEEVTYEVRGCDADDALQRFLDDPDTILTGTV
jgi:hypothetical protein